VGGILVCTVAAAGRSAHRFSHSTLRASRFGGMVVQARILPPVATNHDRRLTQPCLSL